MQTLRRPLATAVSGTRAVRQRRIEYTSEGAVCVSYDALRTEPLSLTPSIEKALGSQPDALGVIIVRELPEQFKRIRQQVLRLAYTFAELPEAVREQFADPDSRYSFGWSHGKEIMNGKPDYLKGSYYANPIMDQPEVSQELSRTYPEYYGRNIWPSGVVGVEGFERAFKSLGRLMFDVGCDLAAACQPFASSYLTDSSLSLVDIIRRSQIPKARLLHYFPPTLDEPHFNGDEPIDSWCGLHKDHSLLSGLCSAMYLEAPEDKSQAPRAIDAPSASSGLYVRTRGGTLTKVSIPTDCLAFQTGEALELATAGRLRATQHCVRVGLGGDVARAARISRETFAVFMGPDVDQQLSSTETFGQLSKRRFDEHYGGSEHPRL
ncbi:clavaminate synthase-like protein [Phanerochaete sordida]|uniref:Clavaminate synthase-like protein n=1 Tax=Phanerochaete sordida TaxID=48140 RepID=A0A9P3G1E2_9APHY|nr:clavaminate synthase-like protein [Phanerochaete sordida]